MGSVFFPRESEAIRATARTPALGFRISDRLADGLFHALDDELLKCDLPLQGHRFRPMKNDLRKIDVVFMRKLYSDTGMLSKEMVLSATAG
jgi:hypothetical protein